MLNVLDRQVVNLIVDRTNHKLGKPIVSNTTHVPPIVNLPNNLTKCKKDHL